MKVGDETDYAGEQAERMISSLHHLVELVEERHEIIDLAAPVELEALPKWITPLRIVTTAEPPRGRKIKTKSRIAPDRWIGIRDHHILIGTFARPLVETLAKALVEGTDICSDTHIKDVLAASFDAFLEHCGLPAAEVTKVLTLPEPYAWSCERSGVRIVRKGEGLPSGRSEALHSVTLH